MKRIIYLLLVPALAFLAFVSPSELPIGSALPLPDQKLKDISGKMISLNEARQENGLLVMFSCNTCPYVVKNQERTRQVGKSALSKKIGVVLLNANEANRSDEDSYEAMKSYAKKQGYQWYYAVDQNSVMADAFGARRTPECYLFNKSGKLVYHGAIDDNPGNASDVNRQHLQAAIDEMLQGKEVSVRETRSVGCGIKRKS